MAGIADLLHRLSRRWLNVLTFVRGSVYYCTFSGKSVTVSVGINQHDSPSSQLTSLPNSHMCFRSPFRHDSSCHLPFGFECHSVSHLPSLQLVDVFKAAAEMNVPKGSYCILMAMRYVVHYVPRMLSSKPFCVSFPLVLFWFQKVNFNAIINLWWWSMMMSLDLQSCRTLYTRVLMLAG